MVVATGQHGFRKVVEALALALSLVFVSQPAPGQGPRDKEGLFITVPSVITDAAVSQIKNKLVEEMKGRNERSHDFTLVLDFNQDGLPAASSNFGSCRDLAKYIRDLRLGRVNAGYPSIHTVAFVHNEVAKHTVLPVLACGDLVMSGDIDSNRRPKARIGDVLRDQEEILSEEDWRKSYEIVAQSYSKGLVFRMIDRNLVVRKVKTKDGIRYLSDTEIQKLRDAGEPLAVSAEIPPGLEAGNTMLDAQRALEYGLCRAIYNTREELARALKLPRSSLSRGRSLGQVRVVWRIEVRGYLNQGKIESLLRRIDDALKNNATEIILQLDCDGGDTVDADSAARKLRELPVRTIAYVPPGRSLDAALFLALGCNEIVCSKSAILGDFNNLEDKSEEAIRPKREMLVKRAQEQGYPPILFEALLQPQLVLYRVQSRADPGDYRLISEAELKQDQKQDRPRWIASGRIDHPGATFLKLDASLAREFGVVSYNDVETPDVLFQHYGIDGSKVRVARDDWLDDVARFFTNPIVKIILIMLGTIGLILEMKMPGVTFPGIMAAICFVLFFWAHSFEGQFFLLAVLLFLLGLVLIGIEIFVLPGFGITGVSGILLVVGSLALVTLQRMPSSTQDWLDLGGTLATFGAALAGAVVAAFMLAWYLPNIPYANRLVLKPPGEEPEETTEDRNLPPALLGAIGAAETPLRPAGIARFGDDFYDVVAEGDFINPGTRVQVIEVEGNRIVVKEI
jgi:membrane-bound serine protease (ClpP class)